MDVLDLPGATFTTVIGGIGYYDALRLVQHVARYVKMIGADFVEVQETDLKANRGADIVARLLLKMLLVQSSY